MAGKTVSASDIRVYLAGLGHEPLSEMAVSQFVGDGMPKAARGRYDIEACAHWYIGRLRTANQRRTAEEDGSALESLDKAERRLKSAKADTEELNLAERTGELMPIHLHEAVLTSLVQVTKQRLLNIPTRLAAKLEGCSSLEMKALLNAAIRDALAEIARKEATLAKPKRASGTRPAPDAPTPVPAKATRPHNARKSRARK